MAARTQERIVKFNRARQTKGTVMFDEVGPPERHQIGRLYLKKPLVATLGDPQAIKVTVANGDHSRPKPKVTETQGTGA